MLEFIKKYIEQKGGKVVGEEYLFIDGSDWIMVVFKICVSKLDVLISVIVGGVFNVLLVKQLKGVGLMLFYGNFVIDEGIVRIMGDVVIGFYMLVFYLISIDMVENRKFMDVLKKKFGVDLKIFNELFELQYEVFYLYKVVVEKVGLMDSDKVSKVFGEVLFNGLCGMVVMNKSYYVLFFMCLGQVQVDGLICILEIFVSVDFGNQCLSIK